MNIEKRFINVGGNNKNIPLDISYDDWEHLLLDIDPTTGADIICDARDMKSLPEASFDSVYCAQNLEHYHRHDVSKVLSGFKHVLKADGFAFITVPDIKALMSIVVERKLDIDDILYRTIAGGEILVRDVIYGYGKQIESSGVDFYAHKTGFSIKSLVKTIKSAGFTEVYATKKGWLDISAFAFISPPCATMRDFAQASLFRMQSAQF